MMGEARAMTAQRPAFLSPERWLHPLFASPQARRGGIVRRKLRDVERSVGRAAVEAQLRRRGFRAVGNAGQCIVFRNRDPIRVVE